jgi:hypothetical protein
VREGVHQQLHGEEARKEDVQPLDSLPHRIHHPVRIEQPRVQLSLRNAQHKVLRQKIES